MKPRPTLSATGSWLGSSLGAAGLGRRRTSGAVPALREPRGAGGSDGPDAWAAGRRATTTTSTAMPSDGDDE